MHIIYFFILREIRRPLVIQGFDNSLTLRLEIVLIGACLFIYLLNLLQKEEKTLLPSCESFKESAF